MERSDLEDERKRTLDAVSGLYENYVGQEGRGAAASVKPDREQLIDALNNAPAHYFAKGLEYGDIREMADEMLAHWPGGVRLLRRPGTFERIEEAPVDPEDKPVTAREVRQALRDIAKIAGRADD